MGELRVVTMEVWRTLATDPYLGAVQGYKDVRVHDRSACSGRPCAVHNPSDHHMVKWETIWRADRRIIERLCPHGTGHPDPHDIAYQKSKGGDIRSHGCDGCCTEAGFRANKERDEREGEG